MIPLMYIIRLDYLVFPIGMLGDSIYSKEIITLLIKVIIMLNNCQIWCFLSILMVDVIIQ